MGGSFLHKESSLKIYIISTVKKAKSAILTIKRLFPIDNYEVLW